MLKIFQAWFTILVTIISSCTNAFYSVKLWFKNDDNAYSTRYGDGICEYYDLYIPDDVKSGDEVDILYLIHGGAWMQGTQKMFDRYCEQLVEQGYIAVSVDYNKLQNGATARDMVDSLYRAAEHIKNNLAEKGLTVDKMGVIGHSSGAHLALMYSYMHSDDSPIDVGFVMAASAPVDLFNNPDKTAATLSTYKYIAGSFLSGTAIVPGFKDECADAIASISPLTYITSSSAPTLIVHGSWDVVVPYSNSVILKEALDNAGIENTLITFERGDHFYLGAENNDSWDVMVSSLREYINNYL